MRSEPRNLVIVLGPTAVGKSATAIALARHFDGEIINCDSMQVYRGFDIGTDKVPHERRGGIPHHLLDIAEATTQFTAADFLRHAVETIHAILRRKKIPFVVGGTGLYIKALLDGLFPEGEKNPEIRKTLEKQAEEKGLESLWEKLIKVDPAYASKIGPRDRVRIIRALEVSMTTGKPISDHFAETRPPLEDFHIIKIGLQLERENLYRRIEERVDRMFERGIIQEVACLLEKGVPEEAPPFRALGYKHVLRHLRGELSRAEAISLTKKDTRHYAKRQMTWFRKIEGIRWFSPHDLQPITAYVRDHLRR